MTTRLFFLSMLLLTGCGSSENSGDRLEALLARSIPPAFLTGPAVVLLTNRDGFTARVDVELPSAMNPSQRISGRIFVKGPRLTFAPLASDTSFIWDARGSHGFVLNAPLQGWAPVASACQVTNIVVTAERAVTETVNGQSCRRIDVTITSSDFPPARFAVWRTADAVQLPVRIQLLDAATQMTIDLHELHAADLPDDTFLPPDGFTRYSDPAAMMNELILRRANARRRPSSSNFGPPTSEGEGRRGRY